MMMLKKMLLIPVLLISVQAQAGYYEGQPIDMPAPEYVYKGRFVFNHIRHSGNSAEAQCQDYRSSIKTCGIWSKYKCSKCEKTPGERQYFFNVFEKLKN